MDFLKFHLLVNMDISTFSQKERPETKLICNVFWLFHWPLRTITKETNPTFSEAHDCSSVCTSWDIISANWSYFCWTSFPMEKEVNWHCTLEYSICSKTPGASSILAKVKVILNGKPEFFHFKISQRYKTFMLHDLKTFLLGIYMSIWIMTA